MNAKKQKKELPSFQLDSPRYFILNLFLVFQIFTIHITLFAIMFRLTIHTAKTSAHIFFIFVSPSFKKRLRCYQRVPEKPVFSPFFLYVTTVFCHNRIMIPRRSRGFFLDGRSPLLLATRHVALVRSDTCIGLLLAARKRAQLTQKFPIVSCSPALSSSN